MAVFTDTDINMLGDFSTDGNALTTQLDKNNPGLRFINRSAGLQGAAERWELSINALQKLVAAEGARPGRKLMIWVSPGWPLLATASTQLDSKAQKEIFNDLAKISDALMQARVTLYMIDPRGASESIVNADYYRSFLQPVTKASSVDLANLGLQVLATQSGGLVFVSDNDIAKEVRTCLSDAIPYYALSFTFTPPSGGAPSEYHRLEVKTAMGGTARTRQGFYTQP
jgi:VWFA-related protein